MLEVVVLIPVRSNDGETFTAARHAAFEGFILDRFGGFSRLSGPVAGSWVSAGVVYTDELVAYVIAMRSILDGALLAEVVTLAKSHYSQVAIYVRYLGISEVL